MNSHLTFKVTNDNIGEGKYLSHNNFNAPLIEGTSNEI